MNAKSKQSRIDAKWYKVMPKGWGTFGDRGMHSGEREMLYGILDQDEDIKALVGGNYKADRGRQDRGVAVATDRRVIFLNKGMFGNEDVAEMPYSSMEGITHSIGLSMGGVKISGLGMSGWRMEDIRPKESAKVFADRVRALVQAHRVEATHHATQNPNANLSIADELEKLAGLVKEGFLTQKEFDARKRKLLGL